MGFLALVLANLKKSLEENEIRIWWGTRSLRLTYKVHAPQSAVCHCRALAEIHAKLLTELFARSCKSI